MPSGAIELSLVMAVSAGSGKRWIAVQVQGATGTTGGDRGTASRARWHRRGAIASAAMQFPICRKRSRIMNTESCRIYRETLSRWIVENGFSSVLLAFVASRLLVGVLIVFSRMIVLPGPFGHRGGLFSVLVQWDGLWYLDIVRHGYAYSPVRQSSIAFFPVYPLLVKFVSYIYRDVAVAGVLTSNLCLLVAGLLLYRLVETEYNNARVSRLAVVFLMFSPAGVFYSSAYPDSTYLVFGIGAFVAVQYQRWLLAGICGMFLSATRLSGVMILIPLLLLYLRASPSPICNLRTFRDARLWSITVVPLGLLAVMFFARVRFGDFLAPFHAASVWGPLVSNPLRAIDVSHGYPKFYNCLFVGALVAGILCLACGAWLKLRAVYLVYGALLIVTFACSNSLDAIPRSLGLIFPFFVAMAALSERISWLYEPMLGSSVTLLAFCTILAANGFWLS